MQGLTFDPGQRRVLLLVQNKIENCLKVHFQRGQTHDDGRNETRQRTPHPASKGGRPDGPLSSGRQPGQIVSRRVGQSRRRIRHGPGLAVQGMAVGRKPDSYFLQK